MRTKQIAPRAPGSPPRTGGILQRAAAPPPLPPSADPRCRDARAAPVPAGTTSRARRLFERLERWLWNLRRRDVEAYLANATDACDLEARMHALARNIPQPYY
jgi:hypothetical protein